VPKSKNNRRETEFDPSASWLSLYPYWQTVQHIALPAAKRYLKRPFPASEHYRFRQRLRLKLSSLNGSQLMPYTPLTYYGLLLACYHRIRRAEERISDSPGPQARRRRALEWRAYELIRSAYHSLIRDEKSFLEQY
jgi:hypothetical protein